MSCMAMARENARTIRDHLSSEAWEHINKTYLAVTEAPEDRILDAPHVFFGAVRRAAYTFVGIAYVTQTHDEGWHFGRLGRLIERADKTSRILDVKYFILLPDEARVGSALDVLQWSALLESTSALHMYRKRFGRIVPRSVADFLILDPHFPRSMHFCVVSTRTALYKITGRQLGNPLAPSEKLCEELYQRLQRLSIHDIIQIGMHEFIDNFQGSLNALGEAIRHDFFETREIEALPSQQ